MVVKNQMKMIDVGNKILELRKSSGLSAKKLAEMVDLHPSQITKIEKGESKPSLDALFRICDALNISLAEFFAETSVQLSQEQQQLLNNSKEMTDEQIEIINKLIIAFQQEKE